MSQPTIIPEYVSGPVLRAVSATFAVEVEDILGASRLRRIVRARHAAYMLLREAGTCLELAALFNRDHTTILYGVQEAAQRAMEDPRYALLLTDAMQRARES